MSSHDRAKGENMVIVVIGGKLVVTIGSAGMSDGYVGGSVDDEETSV